MVDDNAERGASIVDRGVFEHLQIAIAVAEAGDGAAPDELMDTDRLARTIVDEEMIQSFDQHRAVIAQFVNRARVRSDNLLGRDPVNAFAEHAHEIGAAARDDKGLESVIPQILQQFEHRLVGELVVGAVETRMLCRG